MRRKKSLLAQVGDKVSRISSDEFLHRQRGKKILEERYENFRAWENLRKKITVRAVVRASSGWF